MGAPRCPSDRLLHFCGFRFGPLLISLEAQGAREAPSESLKFTNHQVRSTRQTNERDSCNFIFEPLTTVPLPSIHVACFVLVSPCPGHPSQYCSHSLCSLQPGISRLFMVSSIPVYSQPILLSRLPCALSTLPASTPSPLAPTSTSTPLVRLRSHFFNSPRVPPPFAGFDICLPNQAPHLAQLGLPRLGFRVHPPLSPSSTVVPRPRAFALVPDRKHLTPTSSPQSANSTRRQSIPRPDCILPSPQRSRFGQSAPRL